MKPAEKMAAIAREAIAGLQAQRDGIDRQIAEYQAILVSLGRVDGDQPRQQSVSLGLVGREPTTFAGKIAAILAASGRPMTAGEIAGALEESGYRYPGKVKLKIAVASELARHAKKGSIRKVAFGQYTAA